MRWTRGSANDPVTNTMRLAIRRHSLSEVESIRDWH
jgi:hypothetical protein